MALCEELGGKLNRCPLVSWMLERGPYFLNQASMAVQLSYLAGKDTPTVESVEAWTALGSKVRVVLDFD